MKVGIVGATGLVGETFRKILCDQNFPIDDLKLFASEKSKGKCIAFKDKEHVVEILEPNCFEGLDVVFFSSGDDISREWAPQAAQQGAIAIDNSAAFRLDPETPLVVPEINFDTVPNKPGIIANPNCSTIQLVMVLSALKTFGLKEVRVASYQSVSGAGKEAMEDLRQQSIDDATCKPQIGSLDEWGFSSEENKISRETKKILNLPDLKVSAFTVRVPTLNCHGEAVWVTFDKKVEKAEIESSFKNTPFINYLPGDDPKIFHSFPEVNGTTDAFVSRLHADSQLENTWLMWVVADNLYRGAAANGSLIAARIFDKLSQS